jgi:dihydrofolate reductase
VGNTELVDGDAVQTVKDMKRDSRPLRTIGSLSLCRSLLEAGVVERFRVVVFPVITGATGKERISSSRTAVLHVSDGSLDGPRRAAPKPMKS